MNIRFGWLEQRQQQQLEADFNTFELDQIIVF